MTTIPTSNGSAPISKSLQAYAQLQAPKQPEAQVAKRKQDDSVEISAEALAALKKAEESKSEND